MGRGRRHPPCHGAKSGVQPHFAKLDSASHGNDKRAGLCGARIGRSGRCSRTSPSRRGFRRGIRCGRCGADRRGAVGTRSGDFGALRATRAPVHSAGAPSASFASAASLFDPVGAAVGRADRVRPLFRWFIGRSIDEKVFDASTFSKNRDRLLTHEVAQGFLSSLPGLPEVKGLLSAEHFSVDGTLLKAWASMKSFPPKSLSSGEPPPPVAQPLSLGALRRIAAKPLMRRDLFDARFRLWPTKPVSGRSVASFQGVVGFGDGSNP